VTAVDAEQEESYRGRSLAYVRTLLDCPARWASAKDAAEDFARAGQLRIGYPMALGAVCFYDMEPWGDLGLYTGSGKVLRLRQGHPELVELIRDMDYIGWVPGGAFRDAAGSRNPLVG